MTTDTESPNGNAPGIDIDALAKKLSTGDRLLVNDRANPLKVTKIKVRYPNDFLNSDIRVAGPRGGNYRIQDRGTLKIVNIANDSAKKIKSLTISDSHQFKPGELFRADVDVDGTDRFFAVNKVDSEYGYDEAVMASFRLTDDGEVKFASKDRESMRRIKDMLFDESMEKIGEIQIGRSRGHYVDTENDDREVYFSEPHASGMDMRPADLDESGFDVIRWDEFIPAFEDRFEYVEGE